MSIKYITADSISSSPLYSQGISAGQFLFTSGQIGWNNSINQFDGLNNVYLKYFPTHKPARSCVVVSSLAKGAKVEIEAVAFKHGSGTFCSPQRIGAHVQKYMN